MEKKKKTKGARGISRREFLKDAALVVGAVTGASALASCAPAPAPTVPSAPTAPPATPVPGVPTKPPAAPATQPAAGVVPALEPEKTVIKRPGCQVAAYDVKNGRIVRGRPVHYNAHQPEIKPITLTARGKTFTAPAKSMPMAHTLAYKGRIESPAKALYPLQRVDWQPGGDPAKMNTQNRGVSKYKRISWDTAATIIASELKRVADKYGPEGVCTRTSPMGQGKTISGDKSMPEIFVEYWTLSKYGRFGSMWMGSSELATCSNAGGAWGGQWFWGFPISGWETGSDILVDVANNAQLMLCWPGDVETKSFQRENAGLEGMLQRWMTKELGIETVFIDPVCNKGAALFADKWIPVLPSTDCALQLAVAYTWIKEGTYKKDYIATHSVGFDKWRAYVMGDEDGIPKTPAWASPLCGVPEWTIKALARQYASKATCLRHGHTGGGVCRSPFSHEQTRMNDYLLAMQGWGAPGVRQMRGIGFPGASKKPSLSGLDPLELIDAAMVAEYGTDKVADLRGLDKRQMLSPTETGKCILNPPVYYWHRTQQNIKTVYPMPGRSEVHLIWNGGASYMGWGDNRKMVAMRSPKIECLITQAPFIEESPYYSDIILPIADEMEDPDIMATSTSSTILYAGPAVVEKKGEAKTDFEAILLIAEKLGFDKVKKILGGKTVEEWYAAQMKVGYDKSGWKDLVSWQDLNTKGFFCVAGTPGWEQKVAKGLGPKFYEDPKKNPLATATGLLEFESTFLKEHFPDDRERLPVAHYVRGGPESEGWTHNEDRFGDRGKKYPLLMVSNVPVWGEHTMHADIPWTREITKQVCSDGYMYENLWVHPEDAATRGIKHGDIVRIYNEKGSVLGAAFVTEMIRPGVLHMTKARQLDYIVPNEVSRAGSPNTIAPIHGLSQHARNSPPVNGYLVQLDKVSDAQMAEWKRTHPEAFTRDYDPAYGPSASGWVEKGG